MPKTGCEASCTGAGTGAGAILMGEGAGAGAILMGDGPGAGAILIGEGPTVGTSAGACVILMVLQATCTGVGAGTGAILGAATGAILIGLALMSGAAALVISLNTRCVGGRRGIGTKGERTEHRGWASV